MYRRIALPYLISAVLALMGDSSAQRNWEQVNCDGFACTTLPAPADAAFLVAFDGGLYAATGDFSGAGSRLLRYQGGASWQSVADLGSDNGGVFDPAVYQSQLYLGTYNEVSGCEVWVYDTTNPAQRIASGGFGTPCGMGGPCNVEVSGMGVYQSTLYVGTQNVDPITDICGGAEVWSYSAGAGWLQVMVPWGANICEADGFVEFMGKLYVGLSNDVSGCEVWSYDGTVWAQVDPAGTLGPGFGAGSVQSDVRGMSVCGGLLYVGTENFLSGCEVWSLDGAGAWQRVDAVSGPGGFGSIANEEVIHLTCFGGTLYAGVENSGASGAGVWRYDGGTAWTLVSPAGLGDAGNEIVLSLVEGGGSLYASTVNSTTGTELWRLVPPHASFCSSLPNATGSAAIITCSGSPNSSLMLTSTPVPNTPGLFFFGDSALAGSPFGDGLRCAGGMVTRIYPFVQAGMMMQLPNTVTLTVNYSLPYAASLTGTKHFQHWFRSGVSTGSGFNSSNGLTVTF